MITPRQALSWTLFYSALALLNGCLGMPAQVQPVNDFDLDRYLGQWYEIARLNHSFERCLDVVTATYSRRDDGAVRVINRGYSSADSEWREAEGKAYFVNEPGEGYLKVSFFGPFYGSYVIFELDQDYQYAFISGANTNYLWLLARQPTVNPELTARFQQRTQALGFDTEQLIFPGRNPEHLTRFKSSYSMYGLLLLEKLIRDHHGDVTIFDSRQGEVSVCDF